MITSRRALLCTGLASLAHAFMMRNTWGSELHATGQTAGPIRLVEGARSSGLDFQLRNGALGNKAQPESMAGGLGVIDFDGDGWPDLYCVNGGDIQRLNKPEASYWNRLYRNNRDGTFSDVTEKAGVAGRGSRGLWSIAAAWIDYDNDGRLDLFISNCCDWAPGTDPICGGIAAGSRLYCHPDRYRAEKMQLFHNDGNGRFTEVTGKGELADVFGKGMGVAVADFDGDGRLGLFVANDNARNLLFRNTSRGLREIGMEAGVAYNDGGKSISGMGAAFGDVDGDGRLDVVMTALKNEGFGVFLNRGHGQFEDGLVQTGLLSLTHPVSGWGCGLVDLDNDGWLDFFVAAGGLDSNDAMTNRIFRNRGGTFADVSTQSGLETALPRLHRGCAFADFDRDGRLDVAVTSLDGPIELWWNRSPERHWIQLRLTGQRSNRSAIGARVVCHTGDHSQVRDITNSVGYASSSDLTLHFGLGQDVHCSFDIQWPSGARQALEDVAANQRLEIKEPA